MLAQGVHGPVSAPCPSLRWHDDRYWCGLIEEAEGEVRNDIEEALAIGAGCPSTMLNTRREMMKALIGKGVLSGKTIEEDKEGEEGDATRGGW